MAQNRTYKTTHIIVSAILGALILASLASIATAILLQSIATFHQSWPGILGLATFGAEIFLGIPLARWLVHRGISDTAVPEAPLSAPLLDHTEYTVPSSEQKEYSVQEDKKASDLDGILENKISTLDEKTKPSPLTQIPLAISIAYVGSSLEPMDVIAMVIAIPNCRDQDKKSENFLKRMTFIYILPMIIHGNKAAAIGIRSFPFNGIVPYSKEPLLLKSIKQHRLDIALHLLEKDPLTRKQINRFDSQKGDTALGHLLWYPKKEDKNFDALLNRILKLGADYSSLAYQNTIFLTVDYAFLNHKKKDNHSLMILLTGMLDNLSPYPQREDLTLSSYLRNLKSDSDNVHILLPPQLRKKIKIRIPRSKNKPSIHKLAEQFISLCQEKKFKEAEDFIRTYSKNTEDPDSPYNPLLLLDKDFFKREIPEALFTCLIENTQNRYLNKYYWNNSLLCLLVDAPNAELLTPILLRLKGDFIDLDLIGARGSALYRVALFDKVDVVKILLAAKANPNIRDIIIDCNPDTASIPEKPPFFSFLLQHKNLETLKLLLDAGADPNLTSTNGTSALACVMEDLYYNMSDKKNVSCRIACAEELIARGADPRGSYHPAYLDFHRPYKSLSIFEILELPPMGNFRRILAEKMLNAPISIEAKEAVLMHLIKWRYYDLAYTLVTTSPALIKKRGSPLHFAVTQNNRPLLKIFLEKKPKLDAVDEEGNTPLHVAAIGASQKTIHTNIYNTLKKAGAPQEPNRLGKTPEELAPPPFYSDFFNWNPRAASASSVSSSTQFVPHIPSSPRSGGRE